MDRSIVLMGFMAVGKSTVGKLLADELDLPFVDTDEYIVYKQGKSINELFATEGEAYFRELEHEAISFLVHNGPAVIACGGGLPCTDVNIDIIKNNAQSVWLSLGMHTIVDRLVSATDRPLAKSQSRSELLKMVKNKLKVRRPYYGQADIKVMAHGEPNAIASRIIRKLSV